MKTLLSKSFSSFFTPSAIAFAAALALGCSTHASADARRATQERGQTQAHHQAQERVIEAEVTTIVSRPAEPTVNVNTASATELERLPGVGPTRAAAILALRQRMGRFSRAEDLLRVRGIGRATLRRMRPSIALDGATTLIELPPRRARVPDPVEATNE